MIPANLLSSHQRRVPKIGILGTVGMYVEYTIIWIHAKNPGGRLPNSKIKIL